MYDLIGFFASCFFPISIESYFIYFTSPLKLWIQAYLEGIYLEVKVGFFDFSYKKLFASLYNLLNKCLYIYIYTFFYEMEFAPVMVATNSTKKNFST